MRRMDSALSYMSVAVIVFWSVALGLAKEGAVSWVWSGAVTTCSAVVKAKVRGGAEVKLLLSTNSSFGDARPVPGHGYARPDKDGVVVFDLAHLTPDTVYHYALEVSGARAEIGRFRTFADGAMSFHFAFGSCATTGSNHKIFSTIQQRDPLFFLHMGDFHYENIKANDPARFRRAMDRVLTSKRQSALYRDTSIVYIWDDHDYGPNDSDRKSPAKPAALETYQQYVPHFPLQTEQGTVPSIQQAFTVGRVRFIMTDVRSERDPETEPDGPGKSLLGKRQKEWLKRELAAARQGYALVIWVNIVPWITKGQPGSGHGWEPYSHERRELADYVQQQDLVPRLLILSGDGHMVALDDGTNSNYASHGAGSAFPVMHAAPLDRYPRSKGGPYSHGVALRRRLFGIIKDQQFGWMEVSDDGSVLEYELTGRNSSGQQLKGIYLKVRCDSEGCVPER